MGAADGQITKDRELAESPSYPAHTFNFPVIAHHHPALLYLHGGKEEPQCSVKAPRVSQISAEEWADKDVALAEHLAEKGTDIEQCEREKDPASLLGLISEGIRSCSGDQYKSTKPC